jgi:hypothetical protein
MSEQLPSSDTSDFTPRSDNFEWFETAEAVINRIKNAGKDLFEVSYLSPEKATADATVFQAEVESLFDKHTGLRQVVLCSSGDGIQEVVIQTLSGHNADEGVTFEDIIMPDRRNPYTPVPPYESRNFVFDCLRSFIMEVAEGDWRIRTILYGEKALTPIQQLTDGDEPIATIVIKPALRIDCTNSSAPIEVVDLTNERERIQALRELSNNAGEDWPEIFNLIKKLDDAVNGENLDGMKDFEDLQSLHELGQIGARYASSDAKRSDSLVIAVSAVLGTGRYLALDGVSYSFKPSGDMTEELVRNLHGYVEAVLPDVPVFASTPGQPAGPAFVIRNGERTYSMPFTSITRMSF